MNILYDGAIFDMQRYGGISRYYSALFENIPDDVFSTVLLANAKENDAPSCNRRLLRIPVSTVPVPRFLKRSTRWVDHLRIKRADDRIAADITHWTYYVGLQRRAVGRSCKRKQVVTVYDLIHEKFPETDPKGKEVRWKKNAISQADLLICISETTLNDLKEWYPDCASRAIAIPLGNPIEGVVPCDLPAALAGRHFVLFVGKRSGYKNFAVVAKAWNQLKHNHHDLQLVVVGDEMSQAELALWGLNCYEGDVHCMGHVDDRLLSVLYKESTAFVFSSRYEGFGLPAVEAMSCGALLLSSGAGALAEVVGDGGLTFDPDSPDQLSDLIARAIEGDSSVENAKRTGLIRAGSFSWKSMAEKTYTAYRNLVDR